MTEQQAAEMLKLLQDIHKVLMHIANNTQAGATTGGAGSGVTTGGAGYRYHPEGVPTVRGSGGGSSPV